MSRESNHKVNAELFSLEPTALLEFFVVYYDYVNRPEEKLYIHGGTNGINGSVWWQGQEYAPFPIQSSGFEAKGDGSLPRPKLMVSNQDFFMSNLIRRYDNLIGAKVVRKRTFVKFLDNRNFPDSKHPYGGQDVNAGLEDQVFYILRKSAENKSIVEFELASPLELENVTFPKRIVMARYCSFHYRGVGCRYSGPPIADENDARISSPTDVRNGLIKRKYNKAGLVLPTNTDTFISGIKSVTAAADTSESVVSNISIDNADNFYLEFLGFFKVGKGQAGEYIFGVDNDDSVEFVLNNEIVVKDYGSAVQDGSKPKWSGRVEYLSEGYHRLLIRFAESTGAQGLTLYYKTPNSANMSLDVNSASWVVLPASRLYYDIDEVGKLVAGQNFSSNISLSKTVSLNQSSLGSGVTIDRGRWTTKTDYKIGDFVYVENHNVKIPKDNINAIPNWEPLHKIYVCLKDHISSNVNAPYLNKTFWVADQCSKTLGGCKLRFGREASLPFGGFPGTEEYSING
jgi:lambda family phage minor tail protein L